MSKPSTPCIFCNPGREILAENAPAIAEFDSLEKAVAAHDSAGYQAAIAVLGKDAAERDFRIVEGAA